jgi:hypothetical protein
MGVEWGGGLYFNYLFTVAWVGDVMSWWKGLAAYRNRPPWIQTTIHTFFAFMFFNATVVFGAGLLRWLGAVATIALGLLWWKTGFPVRQGREPRLPHDNLSKIEERNLVKDRTNSLRP